jgi:hypothetical protein
MKVRDNLRGAGEEETRDATSVSRKAEIQAVPPENKPNYKGKEES